MDNLIRLLVTLEVEMARGEAYPTIRAALAQFAWLVVDDIRSHGFFPAVYTFPGWSDPLEMNDFGCLHAFWPINGPNVMCIRISRNPIDDVIADDVRALITAGRGIDLTIGVTEACERSPVLTCIRSLLSKPGLIRGIVALVGDQEPRPSLVSNVDQGIRHLWTALVDATQRGLTSPESGSAIAVTTSGET